MLYSFLHFSDLYLWKLLYSNVIIATYIEHLFQKFILIGIFVGQGKTFQEATNQVEEWEKTGISQLLEKSKMNRGY